MTGIIFNLVASLLCRENSKEKFLLNLGFGLRQSFRLRNSAYSPCWIAVLLGEHYVLQRELISSDSYPNKRNGERLSRLRKTFFDFVLGFFSLLLSIIVTEKWCFYDSPSVSFLNVLLPTWFKVKHSYSSSSGLRCYDSIFHQSNVCRRMNYIYQKSAS